MVSSDWQWPRPRPISLGSSMELCGGVHTAQRQITTQIPIEFGILVISLSLGLGHCQSDYTISQKLHVKWLSQTTRNTWYTRIYIFLFCYCTQIRIIMQCFVCYLEITKKWKTYVTDSMELWSSFWFSEFFVVVLFMKWPYCIAVGLLNTLTIQGNCALQQYRKVMLIM